VAVTSVAAISVLRRSPPRPFYVGVDPKTCDVVVPREALGVDRVLLFSVDGDTVSVSHAAMALGATTEGGTSLPMRIGLGGVTFDVKWSEDPALRAIWSNSSLGARKKSGVFSDDVRYNAKCTVTLPIRVRCRSCGMELEGTVRADGEGFGESIAEAESRARSDSLSIAKREALLAPCPGCRHRPRRSVVKLGIESILALLAVVVPPFWIFGFPHPGVRIHSSIFIPSVIGAVVLGGRIQMWFSGSRIRLRPVSAAAVGAGPAGPASATWQERTTSDGHVITFVGSRPGEREALEIAAFASSAKPKDGRLPGCAVQVLGVLGVLTMFAGKVDGDVKGRAIHQSEAAVLQMCTWLFVVTVGSPLLLGLLGWLARAPWKPSGSEQEFTLFMTPSTFVLEGSDAPPRSFSLARVARFQGDQHLSLVRPDGMTVTLPFSPNRSHAQLAARLNQLLEEVRRTPVSQLHLPSAEIVGIHIRQLFSLQGRAGRRMYWLTSLGLGVLAALTVQGIHWLGLVVQALKELAVWLPLAVRAGALWAAVAIHVKRLHDRDKSGWWFLLAFVPFVGQLWLLVEMGFLRGTAGSNRYGDDPVEPSA
jgi:uncharacterized membrane protein YhaH (DUF805 family)